MDQHDSVYNSELDRWELSRICYRWRVYFSMPVCLYGGEGETCRLPYISHSLRDAIYTRSPCRGSRAHCDDLGRPLPSEPGGPGVGGDLIRLFLGNDGYLLAQARESLILRALFAEADGDIARSIKLQNTAESIAEDLRAHPGTDGFIFHSEVVIWKDPLVAASRTHALGLAHKQIVKDAAMCRQGIADYLITMRVPGENTEPVSQSTIDAQGKKLHRGFERYIGENEAPKVAKGRNGRENKFSHLVWQRYASPVWMDINPSDTLQRESAREQNDERHICPLQLQVIRRGIELWTNPGDTVLDPFGGIGSTGYVAIQEGRKSISIELKRSYWEQNWRNHSAAVKSTQFGLLPILEECKASDAADETADSPPADDTIRFGGYPVLEPDEEDVIR